MKFLLATALTVLVICVAALGCGGNDGGDTTASAANVPRAFFGVAPQGNIAQEDLERMGAGNVGTLRIVLPWQLLDPKPNTDAINFSGVDPIVLLAAQNGIQVLPTIYGTPDWVAQQLDGDDCGSDEGQTPCATFAPRSDAALAEWKDFIGKLVDRYGPEGTFWGEHTDTPKMPIRTWQIWNEQNSSTFYSQPDPASYDALLSNAADAIRKRDSGATVMLGGMFQTSGQDGSILANKFLRQLYDIDGASDDFDAVASHPYAHSLKNIEAQVRLMHDVIDRAGDDAPLWVTEIGASSSDGKNPLELGEEGQANLLRSAFNFFLDKRQEWNLGGVIWYAWRDVPEDSPGICDWCANAGLFPVDSLDPKPAWAAFTSFTGGN